MFSSPVLYLKILNAEIDNDKNDSNNKDKESIYPCP